MLLKGRRARFIKSHNVFWGRSQGRDGTLPKPARFAHCTDTSMNPEQRELLHVTIPGERRDTENPCTLGVQRHLRSLDIDVEPQRWLKHVSLGSPDSSF
jgi:hypothetical protein